MELRKTRKRSVKIAGSSESSGLTTYTEDQTTKKKRRVKQTVKQRNTGGKTAMGTGNSHVYDPTDSLNQEGNASSKCPVLSSSQKTAYIGGHTSALLQCTQCPTAQFLCDSCLYPRTPDSATCTNKLCPLVSTLLTCGVVSDPQSKVFGCPEFRACPKCRNLITHAKGCKFVTCLSCHHRFCFICLQVDCSKNTEQYWSLTCKKPRADRQRFILT